MILFIEQKWLDDVDLDNHDVKIRTRQTHRCKHGSSANNVQPDVMLRSLTDKSKGIYIDKTSTVNNTIN